MFEKVAQRMKAILLSYAQQRQPLCAAFCNFKFIIKRFKRNAHLRKCFSTLEEKFCVSVWPCNILYLIFLEVISRFHEKVWSHFVK